MIKVEKIPANEKGNKLIRVAAYCRVSKNVDEQLSSLEYQITHFESYKEKENDIELVEIFYDYGKSGLRRKGRNEYQRMIALALNNECDYILTKSVSRFSRNTLDVLVDVRKLREKHVYVYFEKEKIDTKRDDYEIILAIYASLSQEESIAASKNIAWGIRAKMKRGELAVKSIYGYRKVNDELVIVEKEAGVVKLIYFEYLRGRTLKQIKELLEDLEIKLPSSREKWDCKTINNILSNEKYIGNVIQQKTYVKDTLNGIRKENKGELEKVHILNNHEAIISEEEYNKAQELKKKRSRCIIDENGNKVIRHNQYSSKSIYSNLLVCGYCGASYRRRTERGKVVYRCATRIDKGRDKCQQSITLEEKCLKEYIEQETKNGDCINSCESVEMIEVFKNNIVYKYYGEKKSI